MSTGEGRRRGATFITASFTDPLNVEPDPLCMNDSTFDADGFALPAQDGQKRGWVPLWGGACVKCGKDC